MAQRLLHVGLALGGLLGVVVLGAAFARAYATRSRLDTDRRGSFADADSDGATS